MVIDKHQEKMKNNNIFYLHFILIIFPLTNISCQSKKEKDFVWFVVQPEVELGKSIDFTVHFKEKPDSIYTNVKEINGLELTDHLDQIRVTSESSLTDDEDKVLESSYKFYTYAKPTKLGRIDFPIVTVVYKGKEYKTKPFHINVVNKISIDKNDIKVAWSAEKSSYKKTDTIKLSLYEYSKFSESTRKHSSPKNISLKGQENQINLSYEDTIDNIAGIDNFENLLNQKFEIVNFNWNMSNYSQSMEEIDGEIYIKVLIISLDLLPKTKGKYTFGPSDFDYFIYKNNADYFKELVPNDNGSYSVTENGSTQLKIKSNTLAIEIN